MQETPLADSAPAFHQFGVHDHDLACRAAEADESQLEQKRKASAKLIAAGADGGVAGALPEEVMLRFMQPIPPSNTKVGLPVSDATKAAWANPNDKPVEDYATK